MRRSHLLASSVASALVLGLFLGGCADSNRAKLSSSWQASCTEKGLKKGTPEFTACVKNEEKAYLEKVSESKSENARKRRVCRNVGNTVICD